MASTFSVSLSGAANGTLADSQAVGTIVDVDAPPTLSLADVTVAEGAAAVFTLVLDGPSAKQVSVDYQTSNGSASAGSDFAQESAFG